MPSPIGHALTGFAIQQARPSIFMAKPWQECVLFLLLGNLPDLDFLPGLLSGFPNLYHHGIFHSLGAALIVSIAGGALVHWLWKRPCRDAAAILLLLYVTHLLLDYFAGDTKPPYGMPLFWPFSGDYFIAPRQLFLNIVRSQRSEDFFSSMVNRHNLDAVLREVMLLGGVALATWLWRRRRRKAGS
jgi:inner membrane protein